MAELLPVPLALKSIRPYVKVGIEIAKRDPCVSYYCNFFAMQSGLKTNYKASPEGKAYLLKLMDTVEHQKEQLKSNPEHAEAVTSDITGQAMVEATAMKLFVWADSQDRSGVFNKHVVKSFYTASILFDVMEVFEEGLNDEAKTHRKYARWKATYIHNCLKNNEKPIAGPVGGLEDEWSDQNPLGFEQQPSSSQDNSQNFPGNDPSLQTYTPEVSAQPRPAPRSVPQPTPQPKVAPPPDSYATDDQATSSSASSVSPQAMREAGKLCKFAGSSLQYDDVPSAIQYLEKCLTLLRTGHQ